MSIRTGDTVRSWAMLYKVVVHTVLLYGIKSWVVTVAMLKFMEIFHHWVDRQIEGNTDWLIVDIEW